MIVRTPLIVEGVRRAQRRWEKAHKRLAKAHSAAYVDYERRLETWEKRREGESPDAHVERLKTGDIDDHLMRQVRREREHMIAPLERREAKLDRKLERAKQRESPRKRAKRMAKDAARDERARQADARKVEHKARREEKKERKLRTPAAVIQAATRKVIAPRKLVRPRRRRA